MLNRINIMGRLTKDPELRRTQNGIPCASFSVACDRDFGDDTDFFDVVAWRNTAEFISKYFAKGRMIVIDGRLQMREWKDNEGRRRKNIEIVVDNAYFGDSKKDSAPTAEQTFEQEEVDDEHLPF